MTAAEAFQAPRPGQLEFTRDEILADHPVDEPLIAAGVLCHGGFVDGVYISPRTLIRDPAIANWKQRLSDEGHPLLDIPTELVPPSYPNYPQSKMLLQEGLADPVARALTLISIVEGMGARIRDVPRPDFAKEIKEDIGGTAIAHLGEGLFEAHARDESGYRTHGGHKQMWEAARDLGLDKPDIPGEVLMQLMAGGGQRQRKRLFPELSEKMEGILTIMANVMVIEIFAADTFQWGYDLLGDPEVSANPKEASEMVAHIRDDEAPHVEYLRTTLSELRARTILSEDGKREFRGEEVIDKIFERQLRGMATQRPEQQREQVRSDIASLIQDKARASELWRKFENLDSGWTFPKTEDESLDLLLESA